MGVLLAVCAAATPVSAVPPCTPVALNALLVPALTVTSATAVGATVDQPALCVVQGRVAATVSAAPAPATRFTLWLPDIWRQRFLFLEPSGSPASPADPARAVGNGYATATADGSDDPDSADPRPAAPFQPAIHAVSVAAKAFTRSVLRSADRPRLSPGLPGR